MSKVIKFFSLAVPLLLLVGTVQADVRVYADIEATEKALRHNNWMTDKGVDSHLLAQVTCQSNIGKEVIAKHSQLYSGDGACIDHFLKRNGINTDMITPEQFRVKGNVAGWWLPTTPVETVSGTEVPAITQQLTDTQRRVDMLEKSGQTAVQTLKGVESKVAVVKRQAEVAQARSARVETAVNKLDSTLKGVNQQLGELAPLVSSVEDTKTQVANINERLGGFESNAEDLTGTVNTLTEAIDKINGRWLTTVLVIALLTGVGFVVLGLRLRRQTVSVNAVKTQAEDLTKETLSLKQIITGSINDDGEVGGLMKTANNLIEGQERTDSMMTEHGAAQQDLAEKQQQLSQQVEQLTEQQRLLDNEVDELRKRDARTTNLLVQVAETAEDAHALAVTAFSVKFDQSNPGLDMLEALPIGRKYAAVWKGEYNNGRFAVEIWKEETTPKGLVETNVVRSASTGQLSMPIALKRLRQRIEVAVVDGRVPVIKLLSVA